MDAEVWADQGLSDLGQPDHGQVGGGPGIGGCSWERSEGSPSTWNLELDIVLPGSHHTSPTQP